MQVNGKRKHDVCVFCPVGELKFVAPFLEALEKQSFREFDLLFVYRKGLAPANAKGFNALWVQEGGDYGTAGAFYLGQSFAYELGYEFVVLADIDAVVESQELIGKLVQAAKQDGKVHMPVILEPNRKVGGENPNGFGCIPRGVFEKVGFSNPFFYRGGEDWDFVRRLRKAGLYVPEKNLVVIHPASGVGIFLDAQNSAKYATYYANGLKSYAWAPDAKGTLRYCREFCKLAFFGCAFWNSQMLLAALSWWSFARRRYSQAGVPFSLVQESHEGKPGKKKDYVIFAELVLRGRSETANNAIVADVRGRAMLAAGALVGALLVPVFILAAGATLLLWQAEKRKAVGVASVGNIGQARMLMDEFAANGRL
ncbi:Uncharacterised protein [Candidatus Anstonella stagnisolia]|nr:Uncharacterised protein [Candidatus Anstonella stagnisolia]